MATRSPLHSHEFARSALQRAVVHDYIDSLQYEPWSSVRLISEHSWVLTPEGMRSWRLPRAVGKQWYVGIVCYARMWLVDIVAKLHSASLDGLAIAEIDQGRFSRRCRPHYSNDDITRHQWSYISHPEIFQCSGEEGKGAIKVITLTYVGGTTLSHPWQVYFYTIPLLDNTLGYVRIYTDVPCDTTLMSHRG